MVLCQPPSGGAKCTATNDRTVLRRDDTEYPAQTAYNCIMQSYAGVCVRVCAITVRRFQPVADTA
eukprot:10536536-Alexandrium_andersonii.AAC.1